MTDSPAASRRPPLTTRALLTCVAIAVATALLGVPAGWLSAATSASFPPAFLSVAGLMIFPSIVAFRLLTRGGVGLLASGVSGLIGVVAGPFGWGSMAVMMFGAIAEIPFLIGRYRRWSTWRYYFAALLSGLLYTPSIFTAYDYASLALWIQMLSAALPTTSMLVFTWLGVRAADALKRAGVGPQERVGAEEPR